MSDNAATTVLLEMEISDEKYTLPSPIVSALVEAETELDFIDETIGRQTISCLHVRGLFVELWTCF